MNRLRLPLGLLALALAAPAAHAQSLRAANVPVAYSHDHAPGGVHILTELPDGSIGCDEATEAQATALRTADERTGAVRLTTLPSLNRPGVSQFRILIRATDQLLARPTALLSFRRAAARWERIIQSPVTTVIDLDYGPERFGTPYGPNILGSTNSAQGFAGAAGPTEVVAAIRARTTDPATLALLDAIPRPTPTTLGATVNLSRTFTALINLQALGFRPAAIDPETAPFGTVPNIGFNSAFGYDFDPNNGITAGLTDFDAVVVHEIGHALGFTSAIGSSTAGSPTFTVWDLYRVRPEAVTPGEPYTDGAGWEVTPRVLTPGPPSSVGVQVMFTGEAEYELSTATGGRTGGDGQQASHWRADEFNGPGGTIGIMDPTISSSVRDEITPVDIRALALFGYVVDATPSLAAATLTIGGTPVNIDFLSPVYRGGVPVGGGSLAVVLSSTGTEALEYAAEVVVDSVQTTTPGSVPTVSLSPADGTVAPGSAASISLAVSGTPGGAVVEGRLQIRTNDPLRAFAEVPFQISVGTPGVAPETSPASVAVPSESTSPATLAIRNAGDAPLSFVRVLEPAASDPATAARPFAGDPARTPVRGPLAEEAAPTETSGDGATAATALAQLNITGAATLRLYDLAQLPNGDIAAVDGGVAGSTTVYVAPADLSAVSGTFTGSLGGIISGIAYNDRTGSLWVANQDTGTIREIRLEGGAVVLTGAGFETGIAPFGLAYSPELDAFFVGTFGGNGLYAFSATGTLLPGYPAAVLGRTTPTAGLSFTEGLLDVNSLSNRAIQAGQFGNTVAGTTPFVLPVLTYGLERSRTDPNGTLYFTSRTSAGVASIRTLDPEDLPAGVGTRIEAASPLFENALVAPGETRTLSLLVDGRGVAEGQQVTDELAFLTNAPTNRVVRFPVTIDVTAVAGEAGAETVLDAVATWPNPARGETRVQLTLASATEVTVGVYNTLGQRVAVLAQGTPFAAGTHALAFDAGTLAAGVYVVRVTAGTNVSTHKVTVIR